MEAGAEAARSCIWHRPAVVTLASSCSPGAAASQSGLCHPGLALSGFRLWDHNLSPGTCFPVSAACPSALPRTHICVQQGRLCFPVPLPQAGSPGTGGFLNPTGCTPAAPPHPSRPAAGRTSFGKPSWLSVSWLCPPLSHRLALHASLASATAPRPWGLSTSVSPPAEVTLSCPCHLRKWPLAADRVCLRQVSCLPWVGLRSSPRPHSAAWDEMGGHSEGRHE